MSKSQWKIIRYFKQCIELVHYIRLMYLQLSSIQLRKYWDTTTYNNLGLELFVNLNQVNLFIFENSFCA